MFNMKDLIYLLIIFGLGLTLFNYCSKPPIEKEVVVYKTDTIVKIDTIIKYKPKPIEVKSEPDTIYLPSIDDSVAVDREIKLYKDSTYEVQISGFKAELDKITVYPRETTIYKEKVLEIKEKRPKIDFGVQVGVGYLPFSRKLEPYIGYGVQINF